MDYRNKQKVDLFYSSNNINKWLENVSRDRAVDRVARVFGEEGNRQADERIRQAHAHNLRSAVYTLPTEIITLIFEDCLRSRTQWRDYDCSLALSHVSYDFRAVAVTTPSLWTEIKAKNITRETQLMISEYLLRSQERPLQIYLRFESPNRDYFFHQNLRSALDLLVLHIHRWQVLHLTGHLRTAMKGFRDRLGNAWAPFIESLCVCDTTPALDNPVTASLPQSPTFFSLGAPRLTSIQFHGIRNEYCDAPVTAVKKLQITSIRGATSFPMGFSKLSSLTHLNIDDSYDIEWNHISPIHLPALITLAIHSWIGRPVIPSFLTSLRAPKLQSLILGAVRNWVLERLFGGTDPLEASRFPSLSSLTMQPWDDETIRWDRLTIVFPDITHFTLIYPSDKIAILEESGLSALNGWHRLHTLALIDGQRTSLKTAPILAPMLWNFLEKRKSLLERVPMGHEEGRYRLPILRTTKAIIDSIGGTKNLAIMAGQVETCESLPFLSRAVDKWLDI